MRHVDLWSTYLVGYMSDDIDTYLCSGLTQGGAMAGGQSKNSHNVWNRQEALRLQKQNAAAQKAADRERELEETAAGKAEAEQLNADLAARVTRLESILWNGLERVAAVDLNALLRHDEFPPLELGSDGVAPPRPSWLDYAPPAPGGIAGLFGGRARHDLQLDAARQAFERAERDYDQAEVIRQGRIREKTSRYEAALLAHQNDVARRNGQVAQLPAGVRNRDRESVQYYLELALSGTLLPEDVRTWPRWPIRRAESRRSYVSSCLRLTSYRRPSPTRMSLQRRRCARKNVPQDRPSSCTDQLSAK